VLQISTAIDGTREGVLMGAGVATQTVDEGTSPSLVVFDDASSRRRTTFDVSLVGIVVAGLLFGALATAVAFRLPPLFGADERPHLSYVASLTSGQLPTLDDPLPADDERFRIISAPADGGDPQRAGPVFFVAHHPPLYYAVVAGPVWLSTHVGPNAPALMMRLLNVTFMSLGVMAIGWSAAQMFPSRARQVGTLAAALMAVTATAVGNAALGYNDGLAVLLVATSLGLMARVMRFGPSGPLVGVAAGLAAASFLTRAALFPVVGGLALAVLVGAWRHRRDRWLVRGVIAASIVPLAAFVTSGWFYLRNVRLYGNPTGAGYAAEELGRTTHRSLGDVLFDYQHHKRMWRRLFGHVPDQYVEHPQASWLVLGLVLVVLFGGALGLWRWWRGRDVQSRATEEPVENTLGLGGLVFAGYAVAAIVSVADYVQQGGGQHGRYYLVVLPLVCATVARAIVELPFRRWVALLTFGAILTVTIRQLRRYDGLVAWKRGGGGSGLLFDGQMVGSSAQWTAVILAGVACVVVAAIVLYTLRPAPRT
jgi:hypothetical protein